MHPERIHVGQRLFLIGLTHTVADQRLDGALVFAMPDNLGVDVKFAQQPFDKHKFTGHSPEIKRPFGIQADNVSCRGQIIGFLGINFSVCNHKFA
ncbi:hypothetical protein DSECCO2_247000 [anaerobic digester metagenome]